MRGLKICLWIAGIVCLLSACGVFLPASKWDSITTFFGTESFPVSPVVMYFIRVMSATYAGVGVFFIILALRPMNYGIIVPFSGWTAVALGAVCWITGYVEGMPNLWFLSDSLSCLVFGALVVLFWQTAKKTPNTQTEEA
jgi:hypothetical protein